MAYCESKQLDGETHLKVKKVPKEILQVNHDFNAGGVGGDRYGDLDDVHGGGVNIKNALSVAVEPSSGDLNKIGATITI